MKKLFILGFILLLCSCNAISENEYAIKKTDELEYIKNVKDDNSVTIGAIFAEKTAVFVPSKISGMYVTGLGFSRGMTLHTMSHQFKGERVYFPNSIQFFCGDYIQIIDIDVFYCGKLTNLGSLTHSTDYKNIYVPYDLYEEYRALYNSVSNLKSLKAANVTYYLNYPDSKYEFNEYYYVDYYELGEKIKYIPPIPEKDGYEFGGWFKESDCINEWDFDVDTIVYNSENSIINLYAKWVLI